MGEKHLKLVGNSREQTIPETLSGNCLLIHFHEVEVRWTVRVSLELEFETSTSFFQPINISAPRSRWRHDDHFLFFPDSDGSFSITIHTFTFLAFGLAFLNR
jgi:hypothetical protein